jgi:hypothetical protein
MYVVPYGNERDGLIHLYLIQWKENCVTMTLTTLLSRHSFQICVTCGGNDSDTTRRVISCHAGEGVSPRDVLPVLGVNHL